MPCIEPYTSSRVKSERIPHAKKRVFIIKTVHKSTNAGTNARVDSTTPPFFSFYFFFGEQGSGPRLFFFFFWGGGGNFLVGSRIRALAVFFLFPGGWWASTKTKAKCKSDKPSPIEGRAKFCTLTRRREVQNGKAQYRNRVPQLSHPAGEHTCF